MIKATHICTNCNREEIIPITELEKCLLLDHNGELHLCTTCSNLWREEVENLDEDYQVKFIALQRKFGFGENAGAQSKPPIILS